MFTHAVPSVPPSNVNGYVIDSTSISLSWEPPPQERQNGVVTGYLVNITEVETGNTSQLYTSSTSITLSSLHPSYTYICSIAAVTIGPGPFSPNITLQVFEAGKRKLSSTCRFLFIHMHGSCIIVLQC